ncbi:L,D-transpeptidase [Rhodopseudomonas palustris]|uniref:L,D-transpeptidase n=1 Tax=Rhodopseudomonas palustris TaxID=1076 RepID=UPI00115CE50B|nr:L,D-transpeptidase [Rhodopseudomonas palustris]QDL97731.1 L,D-transpeptidase [Rhodopseudomonas palustris]
MRVFHGDADRTDRRYSCTGNCRVGHSTLSRTTLGAGVLAIAIAAAPAAEASPYWYWSEEAPIYEAPPPPAPKRQPPRKRLQLDHQLERQIEKQASKPQGPVVIAVSIEQQKLRVYDANGLFAETPVSTGMRGHATPLGVFSVIQKNKYHRSNIYSGAPMPYMQRITWSGIALHAGALPGYPASHGCIRMPMPFAIKMWGWTRMGARVIVSAGDVTPASFAHPLLATKKLAPDPEPMVADSPEAAITAKPDQKAAVDRSADQIIAPEGLRRGIALDSDKPTAAAPVRTADAAAAAVTLTDASSGKAGSDKATETGDAGAPAKPQDKIATVQADQQPAQGQSNAAAAEASTATALPAPNPRQQIAAFVSGKDSRLYVRQNQTPLFDVPVTIAAGDRPLGTHVFTAELGNDQSVRWTVMSPAAATHAEPEVRSKSRRSGNTLAREAKAPREANSPAEALDRLTIPPEALKRIAEALTNGGSLIVSDHSISAGETGKGTDFIVPLN